MPLRTDLDHIFVTGSAGDQALSRKGSGDPKIRPIEDRAAHGAALVQGLTNAVEEFKRDRSAPELEELRSLGVFVAIRAASPAFPLKLDSLERWSTHRKTARIPRWELLAVSHESDGTEVAAVWIADESLAAFFKLLNDYLNEMTKPTDKNPGGHPRNRELVANMAEIRRGVAQDLWTSAGDVPDGNVWWELVMRRVPNAIELLRQVAGAFGLTVAQEVLEFPDRTIVWVEGSWDSLSMLPMTRVPIHEIRRPSRIDQVLDLTYDEQDDYVKELLSRLTGASSEAAIAVCVLDSGILSGHQLLAPFIGLNAVHSAVALHDGSDSRGHGTLMSGLALYGDLQPAFELSTNVEVHHSLESVKILPDDGKNDRNAYALITAKAVALPELSWPERVRVFALAVTALDQPLFGEPTTWSAALDALAAGASIDQSADGVLLLLDDPEDDASRLFIVSSGNVREQPEQDHLAQSDLSGIEEPAQAWNVLTVGAFTEKVQLPTDPSFQGWKVLADEGELSPHSRTGVPWQRQWPNKPDVVFEGGNLLMGSNGLFDDKNPSIALTSTSRHGVTSLSTVNATSAATALAANLAAKIAIRYPSAWPETIRALTVHSAEWTTAMQARLSPASKTNRFALLRRYGWGVPRAERALSSTSNATTLIIEDSFQPFEGPDHKSKNFRLHQLPWPADVLRLLDAEDVRLRVTLSYFIEPSVASRGWRMRYSYASHGLRFELKRPAETDEAFIRRINNTAEYDENGEKVPNSADDANWYLGPRQRDRGSLISDLWTGAGVSLADCDQIAVRPIGGWWKNNKRADRQDRTVRYSLVMSLDTKPEDIDLYTPIELSVRTPIKTPIRTDGRLF